jgi:1-acyl-sn-glycerol-3-phosphate acyltransferase
MIRACVRLALVVAWSLAAAAATVAATLLTLGTRRAGARVGAFLLHLYSVGICRILGVRVETSGAAPTTGSCFVTPNHWGYVDVFVLASVYRGLFVSRDDVARWPLVGVFVRSGGTIFIRRERRSDARRVVAEIAERLRAGLRVTAFLEGGSGTGVDVRRFRSPLVEAATTSGAPCMPVAIRYALPSNPELDPSRAVAWTDDGLGAHIWRLMHVPRIDAHVAFLAPRTGTNRKELARQLEDDVRVAMTTCARR